MNCAPVVRQQILAVEGVVSAEVSAADGTAEVTCLETVEQDDLASAVTGRFSAEVKEP